MNLRVVQLGMGRIKRGLGNARTRRINTLCVLYLVTYAHDGFSRKSIHYYGDVERQVNDVAHWIAHWIASLTTDWTAATTVAASLTLTVPTSIQTVPTAIQTVPTAITRTTAHFILYKPTI